MRFFLAFSWMIFAVTSAKAQDVNFWEALNKGQLESLNIRGMQPPVPILQNARSIRLFVFSASWCSYCHEEIEFLSRHADENVQVVMVSLDSDKKAAVEDFKKDKSRSIYYWSKDALSLRKSLQIPKIPFTVLVNAKNEASVIAAGFSPKKQKLLRKALRNIASEKKSR